MEIWDILDSEGNLTGRTIERGKTLAKGDYHLVVFAWLKNDKGEFLISKRNPNKSSGGQWETVGGSAISGETSMKAAMREVKEELGILLDSEKGTFITRECELPCYKDIWMFHVDIDLDELVLQDEEVADAKWATRAEVVELINNNHFFNGTMHYDLLNKI